MASFRRIISMAIVLAGLSSCRDTAIGDISEYSFLFAENPVMVGPGGGAVSTTVLSDVGYAAESRAEWISGIETGTDQNVSFVVAANPSESARDGKIAFHISGTDHVRELTVRQAAAAKGLAVSESSLSFEAKGGSADVTVTSQTGWSVLNAPDWAVVSKKNSTAVSVRADVNYTGQSRSGEVVVGTAEESAKIAVTQENDNSLFNGATTEMGRRFVYNCPGLVNAVTADRSYSLADGADVLEIKYTSGVSGSAQPYFVSLFEIELSSDVGIVATNRNDDDNEIRRTDDEVTGVQTVRGQLESLRKSRGISVLGGINGDFFYGEGSSSSAYSNSLLHGVMYKRGICLKDSFEGGTACTVFAIMKDGTARIMTQSAYSSLKGDIMEAVGGRQQVLSAGSVTSVKNNKYAPRTAVGVSADRKKVIMAVVDGRRAGHSNGADYPELGKMLKAMGAYNGINLDGGGSSTFVVRETSGFVVKNKPSDGVERAVVNGLAVVKK